MVDNAGASTVGAKHVLGPDGILVLVHSVENIHAYVCIRLLEREKLCVPTDLKAMKARVAYQCWVKVRLRQIPVSTGTRELVFALARRIASVLEGHEARANTKKD